ncbi:MAG: class I SAM-dependent methyltransferase [Sphingomonas sp.]|nr:class I SAM-dependent methyltransferase [Sphingomonas sp.]
MRSRPLVRAVLAGAVIISAVLAGFAMLRPSRPAEQAPAEFNPARFVRERPDLDAAYVVTDYEVVDAMLALAQIRPGDDVIDLGSGDGRILIAAARSHGAHGLGVDIDPARIRESNDNARAAGVTGRVEFRRQDLFTTPLGDAEVLTLYLSSEINRQLRPRILAEMQPGARVVSHDFDMGDWRADQRQAVGASTVYLWIVPARIAGNWTLTANGRTATLAIDQSFQTFGGTATAGDATARIEHGRIAGDRIRFVTDLGDGRRTYEGRVTGAAIEAVGTGPAWRAVRPG